MPPKDVIVSGWYFSNLCIVHNSYLRYNHFNSNTNQTMRLLQFSFLMLLLLIMTSSLTAQQLNFQGVARSSSGIVLASQPIKVRLSIRDASSTGTNQYIETRSVTTSAYGSFKVLIGSAQEQRILQAR
jgi:hypothetical protein